MQQEDHSSRFSNRFRMFFKLVLALIMQLLVVALAFMAGYLFQGTLFQGTGLSDIPIIGQKFPLLTEAYNLLKENAYFELPKEKALEYGMIKGMLQAYNEPFTVFVEPPQHELQSQQLQGKYGGIGVRIERDAQSYVYLYPVPNSPAAKAGVRDGDRLIRINTQDISPTSKDDEIQAAIRGPVGGQLRITVGHSPDYTPIELTIERAEVAIPSTNWNLVPNQPAVGIVHVHVIADTTPAEVTKAILDLQKQGATRFILDVRNNGGGLVEAGVNLARLFLKDGVAIEEQYRGQPVKQYKVTRPGAFVDLPMVVLVNQGTASAAEIFAGALQGQKRAQIVGSPTYGKDTIQLVFSLSDGSSLHVTAAHWWIPGMENRLHGKGLQPDVLVDENADDTQAVQKALDALPK